MAFPIFGAISILACWKWGDWRNWKKYYPTILYILIGDFVTDVLLYNYSLWSFGDIPEKYPILDFAIMLLLYPSTVILFLSFYPRKPLHQGLYLLLWAAVYIAAEAIASLTGGFNYDHGWNLGYSALFDLCMFPLLALHYKKSLLVWPISVVLCLVLLWWFRVPLMK